MRQLSISTGSLELSVKLMGGSCCDAAVYGVTTPAVLLWWWWWWWWGGGVIEYVRQPIVFQSDSFTSKHTLHVSMLGKGCVKGIV
jgi:hypothetical protein